MSRKTEFKGTAASRRRERRANLQSQEAISSDKLHMPTPSRAVLQCKRKPAMRAEVITLTTLHRKYEGSTCLPNVAIYAAGYRKSKQLTAR
ncbi:antitermination protein N [Escherichia coli]|uniref:transcriptional antitermination N peptide n=1 Tax=Escherichia coli TaxID=562 RepID=UPI000B7FEAA8|nr:antitermination protein N [Escherichia coli]EEW3654549.1 antitermination protein N [Escherichia coli]EFA3710060.1 antitermination protein N [Escherichia coli]EFE7045978.1 antitermination protein N [Escherichia coli]EFH2694690.1 antitermination protein N [Escherichia coli]EFN4268638.1 antitermination protein N [Escherichia coli]